MKFCSGKTLCSQDIFFLNLYPHPVVRFWYITMVVLLWWLHQFHCFRKVKSCWCNRTLYVAVLAWTAETRYPTQWPAGTAHTHSIQEAKNWEVSSCDLWSPVKACLFVITNYWLTRTNRSFNRWCCLPCFTCCKDKLNLDSHSTHSRNVMTCFSLLHSGTVNYHRISHVNVILRYLKPGQKCIVIKDSCAFAV